MKKLLRKLWSDDTGALLATEWVFVATILVLGVITGLVAVRQAALAGLLGVAGAIGSNNCSYSFAGQSNALSSTAGSQYVHTPTTPMANTATPPSNPGASDPAPVAPTAPYTD